MNTIGEKLKIRDDNMGLARRADPQACEKNAGRVRVVSPQWLGPHKPAFCAGRPQAP